MRRRIRASTIGYYASCMGTVGGRRGTGDDEAEWPSPLGRGCPDPALSSAGAGRVRGFLPGFVGSVLPGKPGRQLSLGTRRGTMGARRNPSPVRRGLMTPPSPDTLSPRERG